MRTRSGFTLLEVLAAIAILGIWYVALATFAMQGMTAEGESQRRLHASLLADQVLAELEAEMNAGIPPEDAESEEEREAYTVRITVGAFDLENSGDGLIVPGQVSGRDDLAKMLSEQFHGMETVLKRTHVEVIWEEGMGERSVSRTTFGYDLAAAETLLASSGVSPGGT